MIHTLSINPFIAIQLAFVIQSFVMFFAVLFPSNFNPEKKISRIVLAFFRYFGFGIATMFGIVLLDASIFWLAGSWTFADWRFQLPSVLLSLYIGLVYTLYPILRDLMVPNLKVATVGNLNEDNNNNKGNSKGTEANNFATSSIYLSKNINFLLDVAYLGVSAVIYFFFIHVYVSEIDVMGLRIESLTNILIIIISFAFFKSIFQAIFDVFLKRDRVKNSENDGKSISPTKNLVNKLEALREILGSKKVNIIAWLLTLVQAIAVFSAYSLFIF
ncbi:MAG: hypothetical protein ACTSU2_13725 [Promethearchaeota archaeon]